MSELTSYLVDIQIAKMALRETRAKIERVMDYNRLSPNEESFLWHSISALESALLTESDKLEEVAQRDYDTVD
jgi:hypothetical protein